MARAIGGVLRWATTCWLAWCIGQGARWPIVVFVLLQALVDETLGETFRLLRGRHAAHDAAIAALREQLTRDVRRTD